MDIKITGSLFGLKFGMLLLLVLIASAGCAFSSVGREHEIKLEWHDSGEMKKAAAVTCAGTLYSFMLSPVIPFPPIVPSYGVAGNGKAGFNFSDDLLRKNNIERVKLIQTNGVEIFESEIGYLFVDRGSIFSYKCSELDGLVLVLVDQNGKEYPAVMKYIKGKVQFEWGYLYQ